MARCGAGAAHSPSTAPRQSAREHFSARSQGRRWQCAGGGQGRPRQGRAQEGEPSKSGGQGQGGQGGQGVCKACSGSTNADAAPDQRGSVQRATGRCRRRRCGDRNGQERAEGPRSGCPHLGHRSRCQGGRSRAVAGDARAECGAQPAQGDPGAAEGARRRDRAAAGEPKRVSRPAGGDAQPEARRLPRDDGGVPHDHRVH
mmetsp:Transcript_50003/g.131536  ORF Transcript_50003/g.131536 Transcript_50003/m.131536 type:complete len:201 (-) Transcript_50003:339-941(-)